MPPGGLSGPKDRFRDIRRGGSALGSPRRVLLLLVGGEQQDHDAVVGVREDLAGRVEPVDAGQVHVHEHEVRLQVLGLHDGVLARLGLAGDLEPVGRLDDHARGHPERLLVIDDRALATVI